MTLSQCDSLFSTLEEIDHSKMEKEAEANGDLGQEVNGGVGGDIVQSEFVEKREGRKVHTYTWKPQGDPRALLFLCHGYGELLVPYYNQLAEAGRASGLLVFGHDHVGHGRSGGERVQISDYADYTDPLLAHCREMKKTHPNLPLFLIGHSLGGLISLLSVLEAQDLFAGLVLMGPLIHLDPKVAGRFMKSLAAMLSKVWPSFSLAGIDVKMVTSDPEWQKKKTEDPLHYHGGAKARQGHCTIKVLDSLPDRFSQLTLPYLILHGANDQICSPSGSEALHKEAGSTDKTLKVIEGALHNLYAEKEPIRSEAIKDTVDWVLARM